MHIIVGLGNPGSQYAHTHHNAGFDVVEMLAQRLGVSFGKLKCKAMLAEARIGAERVVLAQPQTFMNLSGESVVELLNWYKADLDQLIVVYDDIDLEPGHVRFRAKGSAGTHNGMRSIIGFLGRDDFPRLRVGMGKPPQGWDLVDWVLATFRTPEERQTAFDSYQDACDILCEWVSEGADAANRLAVEKMRRFAPPVEAKKDSRRAKYDFSGVAACLKKRIDEKYIAGAACAVALDGRMAWQSVQGMADIEAGRKMTRDTEFRLASMTKPVTGVATMILKERGLIGLDDPVAKYLPELADWRVAVAGENGAVAGSEPLARPVTIRHCLTHTSGLGHGTFAPDLWGRVINALPEEEWTLEGIVRASGKALLDFQPGTRTGYSGIAAMNVLARICEVVTGMSYASFVSTEIFNPLGMGDTTYTPSEHQWNRMAAVYEPNTLERLPIGERCVFGSFKRNYACGSAGLVGTLPDYLRFALMLSGGGALKDARILSEESVREMATPQLPDGLPGSHEGEKWGLSMRVTMKQTDAQPLPAGCFGWSGAYGTHFWIDPAHRLTAVLMVSGNVGGSGSPVSRDVERAVTEALAREEGAARE